MVVLKFIKTQRYIEIHRMAWLGLGDGYCYSYIQSTSLRMSLRLKKGKRKREGEKESVKSMRKNMCWTPVSIRSISKSALVAFPESTRWIFCGLFRSFFSAALEELATGVSTLTLDLLLVRCWPASLRLCRPPWFLGWPPIRCEGHCQFWFPSFFWW